MKLNQMDNEYALLKVIKDNPEITQRELSKELGLSLGKTNYLIRALTDKGWVKITNFRRSNNKVGYLYVITPKGITEKGVLVRKFFERKSKEYLKLKKEIEILKREL